MSWLSVRSTIIAISWVSIFFLLGLGNMVGLGLTESIKNTGITMAHLISVGFAYIIFAFYKGYI